MHAMTPILLTLGTLLPAGEPVPPAGPEIPELREMLQDRQHPRGQCHAALLLLQHPSGEAEKIVREGLLQTEQPEMFLALALAVRTCQDERFVEELLAALAVNRPGVRPAAAEALAVLTAPRLVERLQALAEDGKGDLATRQAALWTLGRSGRKEAVAVLVRHLNSDSDLLRRTAVEALAELTGQDFGADDAKWQAWWERHKDLGSEQWLEKRLAYQSGRARRLDGDLERARGQVLRLHQQLYNRLPAAERLGYIQSVLEQDDAAVRGLGVTWSLELLPGADAARQKQLAKFLLRASQDGSAEVQCGAVLALARVNDPAVWDRLCVLLRQGRPPVRAAAARSLTALARGGDAEARARQKELVPLLQKTLADKALDVVVEAAENLGALGVAEAGPVLTDLLRHPSEQVRQTAAQALERVADAAALNGTLVALDDPSVAVRFGLVGALAHVAGGDGLTDEQRGRLLARLEAVLLRDPDPGVRGRAATVLGETASAALLTTLWRCVLANEEGRVQEKAWAAVVEIVVRSGSLPLLQEWDRTLTTTKQGARRLQLLGDAAARWQKRPETRAAAAAVQEMLVRAQLEQHRWAAALPVVRELLGKANDEAEMNQRLRWLLAAGEQALQDGNKAEASRVAREAEPFLPRTGDLAESFRRLAKQAEGK